MKKGGSGLLTWWWLWVSSISAPIANGFVLPIFLQPRNGNALMRKTGPAVVHWMARKMFDVDRPVKDGSGREWTDLSNGKNCIWKQVIEEGCVDHGGGGFRGGGPIPGPGSTVEIQYTGTIMLNDELDLEQGTEFDSSNGRQGLCKFTLGRSYPNPALDLAVASMKQGERARVVCTAGYAYGAEGYTTMDGKVIPPNATVCFDVRLVSVWVRIQGG